MEATKQSGSCHCRKVTFETTLAPDKAMSCNCSICNRVGALRVFVPATQFKLLTGADSLTDYQFGKQHLHHTFCKVCGVHAFASGNAKDGSLMYAVNTRCLEGVDVTKAEVTHFDGRKL
jgi:hypothetical protein